MKHLTEEELRNGIIDRLKDQFKRGNSQDENASAAESFGNLIFEVALTWKEPYEMPDAVHSIVGCAFGLTLDENYRPWPGETVNLALKELVRRYATKYCCGGVLQWELEPAKEDPPLPVRFEIVRPQLNSDATVRYTPTFDMFVRLRARVENPQDHAVLVVAHRDHAFRAVGLARRAGFARAFAPYDELPGFYDRKSGQKWTTSAERYLPHDLLSRLRSVQLERDGAPSPSDKSV
jgi:hypothetical protein